jgi:regulator of RNase E activity RraA
MAPVKPAKAQTVSADLLEKLQTYDTPTICNALEVIDPAYRLTGFTTRALVAPFPDLPPMVGYARTATIRATHLNEVTGPAARAQRIAYYEYVATPPGPQIVVIQDLDGADVGFGAFWGEVQSTVHKALGCAGVVTDGSIRDIPQWAPGLNVLAGSIMPSHAHVHLADFGRRVRVAGMVVNSGDLVHADRHGAVVIPMAVAEKVPAACDLMARKEAVILGMARKPGFTIAALKEALDKQDEIH